MVDHWKYYDDDFDWDDQHNLVLPDPETAQRFEAVGFSSTEAEQLVDAGYLLLKGLDLVIDRFHGGALRRADFRSRIPLDSFRTSRLQAQNRVWTRSAGSLEDYYRLVDEARRKHRRPLLLRGQGRAYTLERCVPNPAFEVPALGEVSLVPSVWRRMLKRSPSRFPHFANLSLFEWSKIIYSTWDLGEIKARHAALIAAGEHVYTISEMEDCSDPLVAAFGRIRGDLNLNFDQLAPVLATLLQHYGLASPVLDLTESSDVALFFATHTYVGAGAKSSYEFAGTHERQAVVYVLQEDRTEMFRDERLRILEALNPQRPIRQSCAVCGSSPWALNLPADFLVGVIRLDFDLSGPGRLSEADLFPTDTDDRFLAALKACGIPSITDFQSPRGA